MIRNLAAPVALLLLAAAPVAAQSFSDFERFCIATDGQLEAVQAAAEEAGWRALPASMLAEPRGEDEEKIHAAYNATGDAAGFLLIGQGPPPLDLDDGVMIQTCGMMTETVDGESAAARLKSMLSIGDSIEHEIDTGLWLFSKSGSGFRDERALLEPGADVVAAARQRDLRIVGSGGEDGLVMLLYGRLVPESAE